MAWSNDFNTLEPAGTDTPTEGDDEIRKVKLAIQERLHVDIFFPLDADEVSDTDAGKMQRICFIDPANRVSSIATPGTNEGYLYTVEVSSVAELHWKDEGAFAKQLTVRNTTPTPDVSCLNLELKDFVCAGSAIVDDDTIEVDGTNGLQLKAGGAGTGILRSHIGTDAKDFVDDDTIENDGTNGLQIKSRTAGAGVDAGAIVPCLIATGRYNGQAGDLDIVVGAKIKHLIIRGIGSVNIPAAETIVDSTGAETWLQNGATGVDGVTIDNSVGQSEKFTLAGGNDYTNEPGTAYIWFAILERTDAP